MRKINIEISKAQLESFTASFEEDGTMNLSATLALCTEQGKKISQYSINTQKYYSNNFQLPISVITPIQNIALEIERIATLQCRDEHLSLNEPQNND